jgi:membrane-associated protease RseP (regulator of RpoE activity)
MLYWLCVIYANKTGLLEKHNITSHGPLLMIRTKLGLDIFDRLSKPKKFWNIYGNIGILLMFIGMIAMTIIFIKSDIIILSSIMNDSLPDPGKFNHPRNIFLIPGVNEFIPLIWGFIGIVITLVVHEMSHAISGRSEDVNVKSTGLLVAGLPIGGFAELDEEHMFNKDKNSKSLSRLGQLRILSSGITANFIVAFIAFGLLFGPVMGSIQPVSDATLQPIGSDDNDNMLEISSSGMVITSVNNVSVNNTNSVLDVIQEQYDNGIRDISLGVVDDGHHTTYDIELNQSTYDQIVGTWIIDIVEDSPADKMNISKGERITHINNVALDDWEQFEQYMSNTTPEQDVTIQTIDHTSPYKKYSYNLTLDSNPYQTNGTEDSGFIGVVYTRTPIVFIDDSIMIGDYQASGRLDVVKSIPENLDNRFGWGMLFGLPISGIYGNDGFAGFTDETIDYYKVTGFAEDSGKVMFWLTNLLLWVGWLNFYVGLFNCIPSIPLDGGYSLSGVLESMFRKIGKSEYTAYRWSILVTKLLTMFFIVSILVMIISPYFK